MRELLDVLQIAHELLHKHDAEALVVVRLPGPAWLTQRLPRLEGGGGLSELRSKMHLVEYLLGDLQQDLIKQDLPTLSRRFTQVALEFAHLRELLDARPK